MSTEFMNNYSVFVTLQYNLFFNIHPNIHKKSIKYYDKTIHIESSSEKYIQQLIFYDPLNMLMISIRIAELIS